MSDVAPGPGTTSSRIHDLPAELAARAWVDRLERDLGDNALEAVARLAHLSLIPRECAVREAARRMG